MRLFFTLFALVILNMQNAWAEPQKWVTSWIASAQGPYPTGNPSAQPNMSAVFPVAANGANNQSFRMMVKPELWGNQTRIRLSNVFGTQPVTFSDVYVGLQLGSAELVAGTNQAATFKGKSRSRCPQVSPYGATQWTYLL